MKLKYNKTKKAYNDILNMIDKNKEFCIFDIKELKYKSECHLFELKLKEKYGFNLEVGRINNLSYHKFSEYICIGKWGDKHRRTISWSDDGRQPEDEILLVISFPTGGYIFGSIYDDYPREFFQDFFNELKTYKPKYTDTTNNNLYFSLDNAGNIYNKFNDILKKYHKKNQEDCKKRKILKMESEIEKLKGKIK